jgi:hypothetical protein
MESSHTTSTIAPAPTDGGGRTAQGTLLDSQVVIAASATEGTITEGTARALTAHLDAALATIANGGPVTSACGSLGAFVNLLSAQYDKDVPAAVADQLIGAARTARGDLSCS